MQNKKIKLTLVIVLGFILLIALAIGWVLFSLRPASLNEDLSVAGISHDVEILRSELAVPHIYAANFNDAAFALGFLHARDRAWQLELNRRVVQGRLSELFGQNALSTDRFLRSLGVARWAKETFARQDAKTQAIIRAYTDGVNTGRASLGRLPSPEFLIFSADTSEAWQVSDTIGWLKMMAWDLGGNWREELQRLRLADKVDTDDLQDILHDDNTSAIPQLPDLSKLYRAALGGEYPLQEPEEQPEESARARLGFFDRDAGASNAWAISKDRSSSGHAILANDPHLALSAPSLWYLVHIELPDGRIVGSSLPAAPFVVLGRNDDLAWGITSAMTDAQDFFLEKLDATGRYLAHDGWRDLIKREEVIKVKGADDVTITVSQTEHGPLLGQALELPFVDGVDLSLRWAALTADDLTAQAAFKINRARDFDQLNAALDDFHFPRLSMVFADTQGNIGQRTVGKFPVRGSGGLGGLAPPPSWLPQNQWRELLNADPNVRAILNPASGFIAQSNTKPQGSKIEGKYFPDYRQRRITQVLASNSQQSPQMSMALQLDDKSTFAGELLPLMLKGLNASKSKHQDLRAQLEALLKDWDLNTKVTSIEPTIFYAWVKFLTADLLRQAKLEDDNELTEDLMTVRAGFLLKKVRQINAKQNQTQNQTQDETEISTAFDEAIEWLEEHYGASPSDWRWGEVHQVDAEHQPLGAIPFIGSFFSLGGAVAGDTHSVHVERFRLTDTDKPARRDNFAAYHGPGQRSIYDMSSWDESYWVANSGQIGHRFSAHYRDIFDLWLAGRYLKIPLERDAIMAQKIGTTHLRPKN